MAAHSHTKVPISWSTCHSWSKAADLSQKRPSIYLKTTKAKKKLSPESLSLTLLSVNKKKRFAKGRDCERLLRRVQPPAATASRSPCHPSLLNFKADAPRTTTSSFNHMWANKIHFLVVAAVCYYCLRPAEAVGSWRLENIDSANNPLWQSSEATVVPSSGDTLSTDATARIMVSAATNDVTFTSGEAVMLPLCLSSSSTDSTQDNKITFDSSSKFTISIFNATSGNLTFVIPTSQTQSLGSNVSVALGYLKVVFPGDVNAAGCMIIIAITKLKFASGIVCKTSASGLYASIQGYRAASTSLQFITSCSPLMTESTTRFPFMATATFSDSRPSRLTKIRLAMENSLMDGTPYCRPPTSLPRLSILLPLYFGTSLNVSALSAFVYGSPSETQLGMWKDSAAKVTKFDFNPNTFVLTTELNPLEVLPCQTDRFQLQGDFYVDIAGFTNPPLPSAQNLQHGMSFGGIKLGIIYPAIESISNSKILFGGQNTSSPGQFLISFVTSLDIIDICGPGDSSNMKQKIVLRIQGAVQMCTISSASQISARFLSGTRGSPVRVGSVSLTLIGDICAISLYLSSGDSSVGACTLRMLPAPELPSSPIEILIDGVKLPDTPQPPMPVSIEIDEASPKGVTQKCSACAEWPASPAFSGSVEFSSSVLVTTLNAIGGIASNDKLTIQLPYGISYCCNPDASITSSPVVCTGSNLGETSTERFDVKSFYPNLVLQWKASNAALTSASVVVKCTWASSGRWISNFDSAPTRNLLIKKEPGLGTGVRLIRTGYSPGRYSRASISATLSDMRPGYVSTFVFQTLRGSFSSAVLIPALGFNLITPLNGGIPFASCGTQSQTSKKADVETTGDFLKISGFSATNFNFCNISVQNPIASGSQGVAFAYIDGYADRFYSAPSISSISSASITLSDYSLSTLVQATITFAHTKQLTSNSEVRLSGFCNFAHQGELAVSVNVLVGTIQASASLNGCNLVIGLTSGPLVPPPSGSVVRFTISNIKTPVQRQARSVVSISTHSSSASLVAIDFCTECAFISEMPLFSASMSLSSTAPAAASVEIFIQLKNVWAPFTTGSTILLAIPSVSAAEGFPGDWKGPTSALKISVNGDMCDASVALSNSGLLITYLGASTFTSLDIAIKLGPYYTVPRKLQKSFSFHVTKSSSAMAADAVSSLAVYPEIAGSCPAGHSLNSTSKVCERCNNFRYNDGTMTKCTICSGQEIGDSNLKASKCVAFCSWPFEYMYDTYSNYGPNNCQKDGGLCSKFGSGTEDAECLCDSYMSSYSSYSPSGAPLSSSSAQSSNCQIVNLNTNNSAVATVFGVFIFIFIACVSTLPSKPESGFKQRLRFKANLLFLALFPTLDFLSDLVYILTSKFNNIGVFSASVFFFVLPM